MILHLHSHTRTERVIQVINRAAIISYLNWYWSSKVTHLATFCADRDKNFAKMTTMLFQCIALIGEDSERQLLSRMRQWIQTPENEMHWCCFGFRTDSLGVLVQSSLIFMQFRLQCHLLNQRHSMNQAWLIVNEVLGTRLNSFLCLRSLCRW